MSPARWMILWMGVAAAGCARDRAPAAAAEGAEERPTGGAAVAPSGPGVPLDLYGTLCDARPTPFGDLVLPIAEELQAREIPYRHEPEPRTDCSGIFRMVVQEYNQQCPGQELPMSDPGLSSKALGRWYLDQGLLTLVDDPLAHADLIHPGTVVFFGDKEIDFASMAPVDAIAKVHHVGLVVETFRNDAGELEKYRMFHGRNSRTYASITNFHYASSDPPLGYGQAKVVGVTPLAKPLGERVLEKLGLPPLPGEVMLTCNGDSVSASELVTPVAEALRGKTVRVRWKNERDKVRVFMVLAERIAEQCPELELPPEPAQANHADLAQWFVAQGRFEVVDRAGERGDWIIPGSVLFFGPADLDYSAMDVEDVIKAIRHMAVVVSVTRDANGHVAGYTVFRAPPEGAYAAEFVEGNALAAALPFGLDGMAWLAVAPIATGAAGGG